MGLALRINSAGEIVVIGAVVEVGTGVLIVEGNGVSLGGVGGVIFDVTASADWQPIRIKARKNVMATRIIHFIIGKFLVTCAR